MMNCRRGPTASASLALNDIVVRFAPPVRRCKSCTFAGLPVWRASAVSSRVKNASSLMHYVRRRGACLFARTVARPAPAAETEHHLRDAPHLYLLRAFGNSIASMMPVDVLERFVARIAQPAVDLHRAIGSLANQPVRAIVAHRPLVRQFLRHLGLGHLVHLPRRLMNQRAEHRSLGLMLDQRPLNGLVGSEGLAEGLALLRILDAFVDAILRGAERGGRLADAILVYEVLRDFQPVFRIAKRRVARNVHLGKRDSRMVGRHVEGP